MASCDPGGLAAGDTAALLDKATPKAQQLQAARQAILGDIYNAAGTAPDLSINVGASSMALSSAGLTRAIPYIVADDGTGIAAVTASGSGRGLAYGTDVLSWMAGTSTQQQHLPLFTRAFTWTLTGKAGGTLPATIKFAQSGYSSSSVKNFITRLGKQTQEISCDIASAGNTCWQGADLLVFGANTPDSAGLSDLVRGYLKAGKAVIYMHGGWWVSAGGNSVTAGMGMVLGGYPGNYFASAPSISVSSSRTVAQSLAAGDQYAGLLTTLGLLAQASYSHDFSADPAPVNGINQLRGDLQNYDASGTGVCASDNTDLQRLLVLWADQWRPSVVYGQINRGSDSANFLRAYASDSWLALNRTATRTSPGGQGDWMPAAAQKLATSSADETITITLPQASGRTAIGRGAVPAMPVTIAVASAPAGVSLGLQTGFIRASGNPLTDNNNYARPRQPQAWALPLGNTAATHYISPFGGALFLNYSGATAGQTVSLRIHGVVKYAHFDFSNGAPSQAEQDAAVAALKRQDFGWSTAKFRSGEVQQTMTSALSSMGTLSPQDYIVKRFQNAVMDTNHIVNGYNDMPLSTNVASLCSAFSWDCSGSTHNPPGIQHFVSWIANCGDGCSGQPIDNNNWGLSPTWGWAHELGHNTVQHWMTIVIDGAGCTTECDNNTLSMTAMLRGYVLLGEDYSGGNTSYDALYQMIQANRASGLSGEAQRADMESRLWGGGNQNAMRAMYMELAFLYTRSRLGLAQPTMDSTLDFMTLLSKGGRLVAQNWTSATAGNYGMSRYSSNSISNYELQYVLSSKIIGQDLRDIFALYGVPLSQTALDSVGDLGLPLAQQQFYAIAKGKANQLATGQWLSLQGQTPAFPY